MTANIKEISDGGDNLNTQSVESMRASQAKGSVGIGLARQSFPEMQADFNLGSGTEKEIPFDDNSFNATIDHEPFEK